MNDFSKLLRIEYGGHRQAVESVKARETNRRGATGGFDGYVREWTISGALRAATQRETVELREKLRAALYKDNQDFRVLAADNILTEYVSAAVVHDVEHGAGPSCLSIEFDDLTPVECAFRIVLAVWRGFPGGSSIQPTPHKEQEVIEVTVNVDGLQTVTRSGRVQGTNADAYVSTLIPSATAGTQVRVRRRRNEADSQVDYAIEILPLVSPYPAGVSDGELTIDETSDGVARTVTARGNYVGYGARQAAQRIKDREFNGNDVDSSSITQTRHREDRVDFSFVRRDADPLSGAAVAGVIEWNEYVRIPYRAIAAQAVDYPGTSPLFIVNKFPPLAIEHGGSIVRLDKWADKVPAPIFGLELMSDPGEQRFESDARRTHRTTFRHSGLTLQMPDLADLLAQLEGPR